MDCCNYGEYRAHGQYGAGAGWEGYGGYAPLPYAPYAHSYYAPHAHDPYARYYRYDYPGHHVHHAEHVMPMDYGVYASKEARVRRSLARRDQRVHSSAHHLPLPPTPPLECGLNGRGANYCEPQMWPHYQMGVIGNGVGWNGSHAASGGWSSHGSCSREHMRYPDCRSIKAPPAHVPRPISHSDGRSTPYQLYEESTFSSDAPKHGNATDLRTTSVNQLENTRALRERCYLEPRHTPPVEKQPPVVPLPAFQQAFGSTEIGKFSEAFSRTELALEDVSSDNFTFDSFSEWDGPNEPQWSSQPASKEIKCEDTY